MRCLFSKNMTPQTLLVFAILWTANIALAASPQDLLTAYEAKSAKAVPARGEKFFNAVQKQIAAGLRDIKKADGEAFDAGRTRKGLTRCRLRLICRIKDGDASSHGYQYVTSQRLGSQGLNQLRHWPNQQRWKRTAQHRHLHR